ncbi:MAG TPA: PDDEXK nuclease domain-containing protein [Acidobacteriaceae bacterium]|nr:PDDEXK nuclease domain-containing protein [Acidobacteriaceae bacterium]
MTKALQVPPAYAVLLKDIKERVRTAQVRAALAVNRELILLYWSIGRDISSRFDTAGWGTKIIDRLAKDLGTEFPGVEGFSPRNLRYMRSFAEAWPESEVLQQLVAKLPWGHQTCLLDRVKDRATREWYLKAAVEHGWSRSVLVHQIASQLRERQGKAITNFSRALPPEGSDLAVQLLKDPYQFDFLTLAASAKERELECGLLIHLRDLLLELGRGFAFVGSQVPLEVDGQTFYLDLLFYHVRLHCYFVIELKVGPFKPEYAGKLNFYLSAADDLLRTSSDAPTLGLLLCESRGESIVEYSLRDVAKPIGVSTYRVTRQLPEPLRDEVPSIEDLQGIVEKLRVDLKEGHDKDLGASPES